jgi:death-on-curing protein
LTRYLTLGQVLLIAQAVTGIDEQILAGSAGIGLLDSAVHAPQACFGEVEFYPDSAEKAAVLAWHLARNHGLPDGNKRTAWVALNLFLALNGMVWDPERPTDDEAEAAIVAVAAGEWSVDVLVGWLRPRIRRSLP